MKKLICGNGVLLEHMMPDDFSDERYEGRCLMRAKDGSLVVIMSSRSAAPARWLVVHGLSNNYFLSHREVMEFCTARGFKFIKGGPKHEETD